MSQIQGTIVSVVPTQSVGYQIKNGYIYTFDMSIQTPQGVMTGEIGSKSQIYPLALGQQIIVEQTDSGQGVKFKKINPQYQPPQHQQAPQQAAQRSNTAQSAVPVQRDYAGEERRRIRSMCIAYCKDLAVAGKLELPDIPGTAAGMVDWICDKGMAKAETAIPETVGGYPKLENPNPDYVGDDPPPPDDDIGF